jgi:hypothetical protein
MFKPSDLPELLHKTAFEKDYKTKLIPTNLGHVQEVSRIFPTLNIYFTCNFYFQRQSLKVLDYYMRSKKQKTKVSRSANSGSSKLEDYHNLS